MNAVIQHFILFLKSIGYDASTASRFLSLLLFASLGGRVVVGYISDRFRKKNIMAIFYFLLGAAIPLLFLAKQPAIAAAFAIVFGFAMGADYMLIPLVTAECFGLSSLGKLLALIIVAYSIGQWAGPYIAGRIFDTHHSYDLAWQVMATAGVLGSLAIYAIVKRPDHAQA
jgi:MFS family permease